MSSCLKIHSAAASLAHNAGHLALTYSPSTQEGKKGRSLDLGIQSQPRLKDSELMCQE